MRNHCRLRRALHILSTALITAGVVIAIDVAMTLAWKEPISTIYGSIQQGKASDSLDALEQRFRDRGGAETGTREDRGGADAAAIAIFEQEIRTGEGIGRIEIPSVDLETVVVEGTDTAALRKGPGHYPRTGFPGQGRTVAIAGHRTTYLAPFRKINEIADGDEVVLEMPYATFTYEVEGHRIVDPFQVGIIRDVGYERLVLTACHPLYSAAQRWAVFARLTDVTSAAASR